MKQTVASAHLARLTAAFIAAMIVAPMALAETIPFSSNWKERRFSLFSKNTYSFSGSSLGIVSDGSVSMTYTAVPPSLWQNKTATWRWSVDQGVPATDLRQKGGDDRNLALYVVFLPNAEAERLKGKSATRLVRSKAARVLVYVWGGDHGRGQMLANPYLKAQGKTLVLRDAGTGTYRETVDLAADYARAFGAGEVAVVGFAVSADSDDTNSKISAAIANLALN